VTASFRRVRARITAWYVGVFAVILLLFAGAVYLAVTRQVERALDRQLVAATDEIERAVRIRESERARGVGGRAVDALSELRIPGRSLFVFDDEGRSLGPAPAPAFLAPYVREALADGEASGRPETRRDSTWHVYGRRFEVGGRTYAAVAAAGAVELEDEYPGLLATFLLAGLGALALVAVGGAALARRSLVPVQRSMERMRRFVADASHELRTPAAVLRSRAEVARRRARSVEEYEAIVGKMGEEAERLGRLVDGMLLLAAADEHRLSLRLRPVFLDDALVEASELVGPRAAAKGVALEVGAFDEAPVTADADLVRQLLVIVLENAVKYTPAGGRVRAEVTAGPRTCRVVVIDTGPGIDPEALPRVFERFYRADPARAREGGAGLGLSIAREIAGAHGAGIDLASTVGEGTTVTVSFARRTDSGPGA
jgi:signal transduction histidine kinase